MQRGLSGVKQQADLLLKAALHLAKVSTLSAASVPGADLQIEDGVALSSCASTAQSPQSSPLSTSLHQLIVLLPRLPRPHVEPH